MSAKPMTQIRREAAARREAGPALSGRRKARVEGFTLIEIMISIAVLAILVVGIYTALSASQSLYVTGVTRQEIQERVRRALEQIALELRQGSSGLGAGISFATAGSAGDETVTFCMCTGFAASFPTWSSPITISTINGDGEADNGVDDNNNRMVDERKVVRTQTGRPDKLLADNLKEGSLRFTRTLTMGLVDRIQVDLTIQGIDSQGKIIEASGNVVVDLRNQ
ncbi:MAG TPA: type II secretion system protein [Planctomycetota bacterium]|nr:type II secretion system protein [Planctomycetota bacterium]